LELKYRGKKDAERRVEKYGENRFFCFKGRKENRNVDTSHKG
jgi:hypothetical protein